MRFIGANICLAILLVLGFSQHVEDFCIAVMPAVHGCTAPGETCSSLIQRGTKNDKQTTELSDYLDAVHVDDDELGSPVGVQQPSKFETVIPVESRLVAKEANKPIASKSFGGTTADAPALNLAQNNRAGELRSQSQVWVRTSDLLGRVHAQLETASDRGVSLMWKPLRHLAGVLGLSGVLVVVIAVLAVYSWSEADDVMLPAPKGTLHRLPKRGAPDLLIATRSPVPLARQPSGSATPPLFKQSRSPKPSSLTLNPVRTHNPEDSDTSTRAPVLNQISLQQHLAKTTDPVLLMDQPLCPDLIVPESSECSLLVPHLPDLGGDVTVTVDDQQGFPVFRVVCGQREQRLRLESADGNRVFATCRSGVAADGTLVSLALHEEHPDGRSPHWGTIQSEHGTYMVSAAAGWRISVRGELQVGSALSIVADDSGRLLATLQQVEKESGNKRWLRIGPLVDAGLVVIAVLTTELLQADSARRRVL